VDERAARVMPGRAGFDAERTGVWVGDWRMDQQDDRYLATVSGKEFSYALTMTPNAAPVLNGIEGFSRKVADPRHASYYYSRPQLAVNGTVTLSGKAQSVTGIAWLDHEWSSELLPDGAQGWDWVGLNLDDGSALMAFRMRGRDGAELWTAATFKPAKGPAAMPAREEVAFEPQRTWTSARTGISYPVAWKLRVGSRNFELQPLMDDQELDSRRSTGAVYWEGAVRVLESGREIGRGYLEMTGYGEKIKVG
jgi:predicted secreted hydrolase